MKVRTNPVSLSDLVVSNFGQLVNDILSDENNETPTFKPAIELLETDKQYQLRILIPGVSKKEIAISEDQGVLKVSGKRESASEGSKLLHSELRHGSFSRTVRLPKNADVQKIKAVLINGILSIDIAKKEELQPKNIEIK